MNIIRGKGVVSRRTRVRRMSEGETTTVFGARNKLWLEKNGATFGEGLFNILIQVNDSGSISQAARKMSMSYRAAWGKIKMAEERWGLPLVITQVGGEMGGGAKLTPEAEELVARYRRFKLEVESCIKNSFREIFGGL